MGFVHVFFRPPMAIVGDLNAEPAEAAMRFLNGDAVLEGVSTHGFTDAWLALHPEPQKPPPFAADADAEDDDDDEDEDGEDDEDDEDGYADHDARDSDNGHVGHDDGDRHDPHDEAGDDSASDPEAAPAAQGEPLLGPLWSAASTGMTFSTLDPDLKKRIDYVFLRPGTALTLQATVLVPELVRRDPAPASDHVGVMITVEDRRSLTGVDTP